MSAPGVPVPSPRAELLASALCAWIALASIPLALGGIGLTWDALNHHMYLGWVASEPRFDRDFLAASYQSYQYPYLYWPAWKLAQAGVPGALAGVVLTGLHALAAPALWLAARACIAGQDWYAVAMRFGAVALGLSGHVLLSLMDTTANDALSAIPLVWAVAFALLAAADDVRPGWLTPARCIALSGALGGVAVAFKLSNGPLAVVLPLLWLGSGATWRGRLAQVGRGSAWTLAGLLLAYGYWGAQLWEHFGNPIYPFYENSVFRPLRAWLDVKP